MPSGGKIVWLASYMKSGNTWLRLLIANYLFAADAPIDINRIDLNSPYPVRKDFLEEKSIVDPNLLSFDETNLLRSIIMEDFVQRCDRINCIKVHDKHGVTIDGTPLFGRGDAWSAVYILRDPRDVAVSLAFHYNVTFDRAIKMLNNPKQRIAGYRGKYVPQVEQGVSDWSAHAASWVDQSDFSVHILRYEDLRANPVEAFGAVVAFMGLEKRQDRVERAVRFSDFTELQRQERQSGFSERSSRSTAPFFRSGRVGAWAKVLTTAQSDAIAAAHHPMMERFGYL